MTERQRREAIVVRRATQGDAASIATIHVDAWRHNYRGLIDDDTLARRDFDSRLGTWRRELELGAEVLVAVQRQAVVGWARVGAFRHPPETRPDVRSTTQGWAEIHGLYVSPSAQRCGVGSRLLREADSVFTARCFRNVGLWAFANNLAAIRFYESCGFSDQKLDQNFEINGQPLVERLLARRL
ncbi:GNAT family N-acetyltransferase [Salinicola sp. CPA57]|uniref:GNAT family N-acetyltransferase n=1 Tax=Salinicola sp. CPA57 TaxID=1949080 RepID=UPI00130089A3|nr:GNAT family N-acetyltransferase [Salinicola sp. CPA57]